jgi:hypothetical protein
MKSHQTQLIYLCPFPRKQQTFVLAFQMAMLFLTFLAATATSIPVTTLSTADGYPVESLSTISSDSVSISSGCE